MQLPSSVFALNAKLIAAVSMQPRSSYVQPVDSDAVES